MYGKRHGEVDPCSIVLKELLIHGLVIGSEMHTQAWLKLRDAGLMD